MTEVISNGAAMRMSPTERTEVKRVLARRYDTVARDWYEAITPFASAFVVPDENQRRFAELLEQAVDSLLAETFQRLRAEAIGATLVDWGFIDAEVVYQTTDILVHRLMEPLSTDQMAALQLRLGELIGCMASGYFRRARRVILHEQETIRNVLLAELQQAQRDLLLKSAAIDSSISAIGFCDMEGKVTYANRAFIKLWGYDSLQEVIGKAITEFWIYEDRLSEAVRSFRERGAWIGEIVAVRKNDETFDVLVSATVIQNDDGEPVQMMASLVDITDRKRINRELQQHVDRLQVLHEVENAILGLTSPKEIAQAALGHMRNLLPCQRASVVLFDLEAGQSQVLAVHSGYETQVEVGNSYSMEGLEDVIHKLERGEPVIEGRLKDSPPASVVFEELLAEGIHSFLSVPLCSHSELIGCLSLLAKEVNAFTPSHLPIASEVADSLAIAIRHAQLFESVQKQRERLSTLTTRLAEAEEMERHRVAQILHDRVGQNLTALGINLNLIQALVHKRDVEAVQSRIDDSLDLVGGTTDRIRSVMADLRPPMLDDYGLIPTLEWYGEKFSQRSEIKLAVVAATDFPRQSPRIENTLFRIAQEALNNAAKHAEAGHVTLSLSVDDEVVRMVISDDGVGFDPSYGQEIGEEKFGWGLLTMNERAEAVGANCQIESRPGEGTRVIIEVVE